MFNGFFSILLTFFLAWLMVPSIVYHSTKAVHAANAQFEQPTCLSLNTFTPVDIEKLSR